MNAHYGVEGLTSVIDGVILFSGLRVRKGTEAMEGKMGKKWLVGLYSEGGYIYDTAQGWEEVVAHNRKFVVVQFRKSFELYGKPGLYELEVDDSLHPVGFRRLL